MSDIGIITFEKAGNRELNSIGSSRIRARWLWRYWDEAEEYVVGKEYKTMIFQKSYWDRMLWDFKGIKIFDECDASWLENKDVFKHYNMCDAVVTSTQPLADYIKKILPHKLVVCIPDRIDFEEHKKVKKEHGENIRNVVWFGYSGNLKYVSMVFDELKRRGIQITLFTDTMPGSLNDPDSPALFKKYGYDILHRELVKYDAAVFPENRSVIDETGKFKSNNKLLTCFALKLPVIQVPEDFDRLASKEAREKEVEEKYEFVKKDYDVKKSVEQYKDLLKKINESNK